MSFRTSGNPQLLVVAEVAEMLRMSPQTVVRYAKRGIIPAKKIGYCWRFSLVEIEKMLSENAEPPKDSTK